MTWFGEGYQKVEEKDKEIQEAMRAFIPNFFIREEDENVYISFLTGEPITFYEHFVKSKKQSFTCPDSGNPQKGTCPLCAMGNKPSFKGAFLIIDHRLEQWKDKEGNEHQRQHTVKLAKWGIRVLKQLQKLDAKLKKGSPVMPPIPEGILGVPFDVTRSGQGTDTSYTFNPLNPNPEHFPRDFKMPEKDGKPFESLKDAIIDTIKPLSNQKLLEIVSELTRGGSLQTGSSQPIGQPLNVAMDDDEDVINFG